MRFVNGPINGLEPDFSPVRCDSARAEEAPATEAAAAHHVVEHDALAREGHHLPRALVDDLLNAPLDGECAAAVGHHLDVEPETAILVIGIERRRDPITITDADAIAGAEIELAGRRLPLTAERIGTTNATSAGAACIRPGLGSP
jgi:hypothetical protein